MEPPTILAIAAMGLDGKIAAHASQRANWTSKEDKALLRALLARCDLTVVGRATYDTAPAWFAKRPCLVLTRSVADPERRGQRVTFANPERTELPSLFAGTATVAILGGTQVYTYFFERDLLDELCLTIEPVAFGTGLGLFATPEPRPAPFQLVEATRLNEAGSFFFRYRRTRRA